MSDNSLTRRKGYTGRISARGLGITDRVVQKRPRAIIDHVLSTETLDIIKELITRLKIPRSQALKIKIKF